MPPTILQRHDIIAEKFRQSVIIRKTCRYPNKKKLFLSNRCWYIDYWFWNIEWLDIIPSNKITVQKEKKTTFFPQLFWNVSCAFIQTVQDVMLDVCVYLVRIFWCLYFILDAFSPSFSFSFHSLWCLFFELSCLVMLLLLSLISRLPSQCALNITHTHTQMPINM